MMINSLGDQKPINPTFRKWGIVLLKFLPAVLGVTRKLEYRPVLRKLAVRFVVYSLCDVKVQGLSEVLTGTDCKASYFETVPEASFDETAIEVVWD